MLDRELSDEDVGGFFLDRRWRLVNIHERFETTIGGHDGYQFRGSIEGEDSPSYTWRRNGRFTMLGDDHGNDLIRRITQEEADALTLSQSFKDL